MKIKKLLFILLFLFFICGVSLADNEIPAPFAKIKEYTMKSQPDSDGDYLAQCEIEEDGRLIKFGMVYLPRHDIICIAGDRPKYRMAACWYIKQQKCESGTLTPYGFMVYPDRDTKRSLEDAFSIIREMVLRGLL